MASEPGRDPTALPGQRDLDELQRSEVPAPSVELVERVNVNPGGERGQREFAIPEPGERPGAVRLDQGEGRNSVTGR
jgi:hypothetical protein